MVDLSKQAFQSHLETEFRASAPEGRRASLRLIEVDAGPLHDDVEQFSLHFRGGLHEKLESGIHRMEHEALGSFDAYLESIVAADRDHGYYQAVFSRMKGS